MAVAIKCVLENDVPGVPHLEGKSLAAAYCSDPEPGFEEPASEADNIITVDFGGSKSPKPVSSTTDSFLAPLDQFLDDGQGSQWHDAAAGLTAVRNILLKLHEGASITIAAELAFEDESAEEATEGVLCDLEDLEQILTAAHEAGVRFHLAFDV